MSNTDDVVEAVSFDLSQEFQSAEEIRKLIAALGSPAVLAQSDNIERPGAFWLYTFGPWLESDVESNREAVNKAFASLRPGKVLPGFPPDGPRGGE
jgi:hypothetical protein